jgi:hypothetical protein
VYLPFFSFFLGQDPALPLSLVIFTVIVSVVCVILIVVLVGLFVYLRSNIRSPVQVNSAPLSQVYSSFYESPESVSYPRLLVSPLPPVPPSSGISPTGLDTSGLVGSSGLVEQQPQQQLPADSPAGLGTSGPVGSSGLVEQQPQMPADSPAGLDTSGPVGSSGLVEQQPQQPADSPAGLATSVPDSRDLVEQSRAAYPTMGSVAISLAMASCPPPPSVNPSPPLSLLTVFDKKK